MVCFTELLGYMWPLNKVLQRRLSVDPRKIINSYETRSLGQTKRPSSYSNSPQPRLASKHSLVVPYYLKNDKACLNFSSRRKHLKIRRYAHVRVKYIFQPLSYIKMYMDLSSVHPQSLRDQRAKGYFSSHNDYGKKGKKNKKPKTLQQNSMEKYSLSRVSHIHKYLALSPLQPYLPSAPLRSTSQVGEIYQPPSHSPGDSATYYLIPPASVPPPPQE